jgi:hypothetical protein
MPSLISLLTSSRKAKPSPTATTAATKPVLSISSLEVTFDNPLGVQAPRYSTYSPDANAPPPPYHYEAVGVEEDLVYTLPSHLSQREALVMLEKEAKARRLEEKRRKLMERDRLMSDNLKMFGL